jgi:hypothetical protein
VVRRGLALYFFVINVVAPVLLPDHLTHFGEEYFLAAKFLAWALDWCASAALLYLAFYTFVRRKWPVMFIGWSRIIAGGVRDPVVGRDVIVGTVAGTLMICIVWLVYAEANWLNLNTVSLLRAALESFREPRHFAVLVMFLHTSTLAMGLGGLFALVRFDRLLRAKWLARAAWVTLFLAFAWPSLGVGRRLEACSADWTRTSDGSRYGPVAFRPHWAGSHVVHARHAKQP